MDRRAFLRATGSTAATSAVLVNISKPEAERAVDIFRAEQNGHLGPLQDGELFTKAVVEDVIPGCFTHTLCYGFKKRDQSGQITAKHFTAPGPLIHALAGHPIIVRPRRGNGEPERWSKSGLECFGCRSSG